MRGRFFIKREVRLSPLLADINKVIRDMHTREPLPANEREALNLLACARSAVKHAREALDA